MEALGSGKKIRGRRHRNWRPDLLVLDDIENDENVNTPEQRRKLDSWFKKAVSKCGDTYTDIMYIGTVLHYDSLLANTLKKLPVTVLRHTGLLNPGQGTSSFGMNGRAYIQICSMIPMQKMQTGSSSSINRKCWKGLVYYGKKSGRIMI